MMTIHLLVTLDSRYIPVLRTMLFSLLRAEPAACFVLHIAHSRLTGDDLLAIARGLDDNRLVIAPVTVSDEQLSGAPIEKRYPREMYYRLFAAAYLPADLDRVLYLDPDIIVLNSVCSLYEIDFNGCFFAAASHVKRGFQKFNNLRLDVPDGSAYVNSGVMMMDLAALRREQDHAQVLQYIEENKAVMMLPDQDVLNALYHDRILRLNPLIYNLSEKYFRHHNLSPKNTPIDLEWVRQNTVFLHYCGRNKPWKPNYSGKLDCFYLQTKTALDASLDLP